MLKKVSLLIGSLLVVVWLNGQCPDRDSLWREISLLKNSLDKSDTPKALAPETRQQLLQWEKKIQHCPYWYDSTHVLLLRTIANTYYKQDNYLEAIRYLKEAAVLVRRTPNNPAINEKELMRIYLWMAMAYKGTNNVRDRMKILDSCIKECRRFNYVDRSIQNPLYERGQYFYDLGDYHHAIAYFRECEEKAVLHFPHAVDKGDSSGTMTYALSSFGWRINALFRLKQYNEAETLLNNQLNKHGANILSAYRGTFYGLQAETEIHKGNYTRSLQFFKQALAVEKRPLSRKQLLNTMANEVYFRQYRQYDKALPLFREALTYKNTDTSKFKEDSIESLNIWSNMAEIYVQKGSYDTAFKCFGRALDHIRQGAGVEQLVNSPTEDIIRLKKIHYLTGLLIEMGNTRRKKYTYSRNAGDLQEAIRIFKYADQLVNRIKGEQSNLNSKLFWRNDSHGLYEHALDACYTAGKPADAFYFFEKSRAVLLNDQLAEQRWLGEQDILQQAQARTRVNALERELNNKLPASKRAELEQEKAVHQQLLEQLTSKIKERNPFYYQNFIDSNFISLQQVQQTILKDYQAFIELFSGDSAVYVMIITARDARLRKIDKQAFDSLAGQFITYVSDYGRQNSDFETFTHISNSLYQLIFQQEAIPAGRVIISPDGRYFPFEALLTAIRPRTWFLKDHAISYTYSARYLFNDFTAATNKQAKTFMGFAPVQYAGAKLPELYESDRSLEALTRYFSTADNFTRKDASRNNFLQQFANYRIIQLYTHASDNLEQGEPVIYFADSLLYLSDLVSDKKPATSLVVLSACETGSGKFYQGEGVFSFNRGFAALGIPAAITSLWKAENKKTYTLTTLFYKYLSEGEPVDVALQHAKLEFMESSSQENGLPYHWAVPVLTGKITDMPGQPFPWWLVLPAIAAGIIVLLLVVRWWRSAYRPTP
ncbi:CHAT domain-containing protein [Pseudoflavitalea sp. X16]|uniref:CHAT domain-containing protein n=1 Tax=Paraflavitalea devenefica TaxID=2716334 RepID=UPI001421990C|nr:CHAT domain-containing tetratricopeptide repeat protein [Paraflavitalea devenefica]NII26962.1 CHAT domain-containing protein [Paraflavitalea devenefica]